MYILMRQELEMTQTFHDALVASFKDQFGQTDCSLPNYNNDSFMVHHHNNIDGGINGDMNDTVYEVVKGGWRRPIGLLLLSIQARTILIMMVRVKPIA